MHLVVALEVAGARLLVVERLEKVQDQWLRLLSAPSPLVFQAGFHNHSPLLCFEMGI